MTVDAPGEKPVERIDRAEAPVRQGPFQSKRIFFSPDGVRDRSPFLRLPEDWFRTPGGFPVHPHRGMQTVTIMLEGELAHRDHTGEGSVLRAGDIQWMTAGRGILHSELAHGDAAVHCLQLWLNLPADLKMVEPRYCTQRLSETPVRRFEGGSVTVYAGASGDVSMPFGSTWPMTLLDIVLEPQALLCESVAAAERTFVLVLSGTAELSDGTSAGAGDIVWYVPERSGGNERRSIRLRARGDVRVLLLSSPVIDDPIVAHGPFVMNTHAQIREAYADLENNVFVRAAPLSALD